LPRQRLSASFNAVQELAPSPVQAGSQTSGFKLDG